MTLEQVMERLIKNGTPEDEARLMATSIIANMDYDKTLTVNEVNGELLKKVQELETRKQDNIRNGGLYDSELEKIQSNIDGLYKELDNILGIKPYKKSVAMLPEGKDDVERRQMIERYQNDLQKMEVGSIMYDMTKRELDKLLEQKSIEENSIESEKGVNGLIERYQKDLETFEPGSPMYKSTKAALDKLLEQKSIEEPLFSDNDVDEMRDLVQLSDLSPMMKNNDNVKDEAAVDKRPDGVENTPLENIPADILKTKVEKPKPELLKRAGAWIKNNKGKFAAIVGAAVVLGVAVGAAIHYLVTNDPSAVNTASQTDVSGIANMVSSQMSTYVDADTVRQATEAATNVDSASIADMISSTFKQAGDGGTFQLASTAYDAVSGNLLSIDPSVQPGVPVCGFDTVNNVYLPLESLKNMTPDQVSNVSVLMGDADLSQALNGITDSNQINNAIASNISHAQGYAQIPSEVIEQLSQGGRVL